MAKSRVKKRDGTVRERVVEAAKKVLAQHKEGCRFSELVDLILERERDLNQNTVFTSVSQLDVHTDGEIFKPERGLYRLTSYADQPDEPEFKPTGKVKEKDFYQPFAEWLVGELGECTRAIALGGKFFKDKWGTPDVIGVRELPRGSIVQAPTEIVSAEIKSDTTQLIAAFGQACAYMLFSHKCYLALPKQSSQVDRERLDLLCPLFGIGLVRFDAQNPQSPAFEIRCRAMKHEADMFYVNKYLALLGDRLFPA